MAYCTYSDVRLFASAAPEGETFAGYIAQADRLIDAKLRVTFDVPFSTTPDLVTNVSSKLAAAEYLKAAHAKVNQSAPEYAMDLYREAMDLLTAIIDDPQMLGVDLREPDTDDYDENAAVIAGKNTAPLFTTGDEREWGGGNRRTKYWTPWAVENERSR